MQCPCNSSRAYNECCKNAHQNIESVTTAESLMRSRYSAFVLANINYLQESHHSTTRPSNREKKEILTWTKSVEWIKLEIINTTKGCYTDLTGTVEFKAFFMENGNIDIIHENSSFCKENNHWKYLKAN
ncbi:YchJ family protein [Tenacibaculum ovolyticum]|uniref:YchJ family protein n=1 Tax=Tenacibaculum ovolyticum TaxID=104270 RepID=UPI0003FDD550|nr:YchJ family metal-binding protein [Tenacibaculum ovolyticum]